jgi:GT2 family glycosyltransferase
MQVAKGKNCPIELCVIIADNSSEFIQISNNDRYMFDLKHISTHDNLGYIGAVTYAIKEQNITLKDWDLLIVSNVDLLLDLSFFQELYSSYLNKQDFIGWIAPCIYSKHEKRDRNPKIMQRPTMDRMSLLCYLYKYPILYDIYTHTLYKLKKHQQNHWKAENEGDGYIYAGHGSFMIFTNGFIREYNNNIVYPSFLFGEEIFFAEEILKKDLKVKYCPNIIVYDDEHISTGRLNKRSVYQYNYNSMHYLKETYFNE